MCFPRKTWIFRLWEQIHGCTKSKIQFQLKEENIAALVEIPVHPLNQKKNDSETSCLKYYSKVFACSTEGRLHTFSHDCSEAVPYKGEYGAEASFLMGPFAYGKLDFWWNDGCEPCRQEIGSYDMDDTNDETLLSWPGQRSVIPFNQERAFFNNSQVSCCSRTPTMEPYKNATIRR